ncbi:MAG: TonB-dependent receptor [Bacteroidetes bacterium]|nr:TonB-dependent receptor [Bacteroidota bacterium]
MRLAFLLLIFMPLAGWAQPCTFRVSGKVEDERGMPLVGATIQLIKEKKGTISDEAGKFEFTQLCAGKYEVEIRYVGYQTITTSLKVPLNKSWIITMQGDSTSLNEVVIEDKHTNVAVTSTYSSLSGKLLEETMGKSLGESMREIPGVNSIQTGPAIFKPVIHGVHSQRVLILNNGIRQEGQNWGVEHAPEVDQFIASNIIVIKDAAAIKYGADALGGVVLVNPAKLPTEAGIGGQLHTIVASNNGSGVISGFLEGGSKKWPGFGWRAQGTIKKAGDSRAANYVLSNTGFEEQNFSLSTAYHTEKSGIDIFYSHFNTSIGILRGTAVATAEDLAIALERDVPQYTTDFTYDIKQPRQSVQHDLIKINAHLEKGKNEFRLQYGFQSNRRTEYDFRLGALTEIPALGFQLYTHTLDAEWQRTHSTRWQSSWGINALYQTNSKVDGTQTIPFIPNFDHITTGLFLVEKLTLRKWMLELGLRYDVKKYDVAGFDFKNKLYRSSIDFQNASGTVSVKRKLNNSSTFTSSLSSAWRPPNMAELYSIGTHQSAASIEYGLLLNEITSEVKPYEKSGVKVEKALKWVVGYKLDRPRFTTEITGYVNYIFDFIYLQPRGVTQGLRGIFPYFRYTQTDASFIGIDFFSNYKINSFWTLTGKASYLRATDETQKDFLVFIPANRIDLGIRYESDLEKKWSWSAESKLRWVANQSRAPQIITPRQIIEAQAQGIDIVAQRPGNFDFKAAPGGYALISLSVSTTWKLKSSKFEIRLSTDNLTNQLYREYTNRLRYFADDVGRNITLGLHYSF